MQTKLVTPQQIVKNLKSRIDKLKAEGKEPTVENLNAEALKKIREKLKEEDNG